jgi:hypothetical protein
MNYPRRLSLQPGKANQSSKHGNFWRWINSQNIRTPEKSDRVLRCRKHPFQIPSPERAADDSPGSVREADATRGNDPDKPTFSSFAPVKANGEKARPRSSTIFSTRQHSFSFSLRECKDRVHSGQVCGDMVDDWERI